MEDGGKEFIRFLDLFLRKFPEYVKVEDGRKLILSGESYAGKYLPLFASYVYDYNTNSDIQVDLKSVLIGDPFAAPVI